MSQVFSGPSVLAKDALQPSLDPWCAELSLRFSRVQGRTTLACRHTGPLVVQRALYPEGPELCQAIVVHPPGGIVEGDELRLWVHAGSGSFAQLTTPGAGKWYRSTGREASQRIVMCVDDAVLEWLPQETIVFDAAEARMSTEVHLRGNARYLGWEVLCLGRSASGEGFHHGELRQRTTIDQEGRLLWSERSRLVGGGPLLSSPVGLGGHTVTATLLLAGGTVHGPILAECREVRPEEAGARVGLSAWPGLLVARYLGDSGEAARRYLTALFCILRPAQLGRVAIPPRIWST